MRYIFAALMIVVLLFPSLAIGGEVTMDDLVVTNGLYYKKFTNVPFTGSLTGKAQGSLKNGVKVGAWVEYDRKGRVSQEISYNTFSKHTRVTYSYHGNGQLKEKVTYKDGKKEGPWVHYDSDGSEVIIKN